MTTGMNTTRVLVLALAVLFLWPPPVHADSLQAEALRQLQLAEDDLAAGTYERAAASAASALRLDPGLQEALVVRALALSGLGRLEDAVGLLRAYRDLRGSLPLDPRVEPALEEFEQRLTSQDRPEEPAELVDPNTSTSGSVALLYGPERPGAAEDAWTAAEPFLGDSAPAAVIPTRSALPAGGRGLLVFGASTHRCPPSPPTDDPDLLLEQVELANVELDIEAADSASAEAELSLACGVGPVDPDDIARLLAGRAATRWLAGEPEEASRLWREAFLVAPERSIDSTLAPTATALQLTAKATARSEPPRARLDVVLPADWTAWVDGAALVDSSTNLPRGRRLVRVLGPDGTSEGAVLVLAEGSTLVTTAEGLLDALEGRETPEAVRRAVSPAVEDAARREGADSALVVDLAAEPAAVYRVENGRWLALNPKTTGRRGTRATAGRVDSGGPPVGPIALLGGGLAATAVGLAVAALAHRDGQALSAEMGSARGFADHYLDYEATRTSERVGTGLAVGGGVAIAVGVVTFSIPSRRGQSKPHPETNP